MTAAVRWKGRCYVADTISTELPPGLRVRYATRTALWVAAAATLGTITHTGEVMSKRYRIPGSLETYSTRGRAALAIAEHPSRAWSTKKLYVRSRGERFFAWVEGQPEVEITVVDEELEAKLELALTTIVALPHSHCLAS